MRTCFIAIIGITAVGPALADGGFFGPRLSARAEGVAGVSSDTQKGIVIRLEDHSELLILQTGYHGPAAEFGWVIPVPASPGARDIFPASRDFVDWLFYVTRPWTVTDIEVQRPATGAVFAGASEGARSVAEGAVAGGVTMHQRLVVGDYDAAVLSATDPVALLRWLDEEGFAPSEHAADLYREYIARDWYFVALRVRPQIAHRRPVIADLAPLAIRFPTDRLVYPLYISRASSPDLTALSLIVIDTTGVGVGCDQLPWVWPRFEAPYPPGASWATLRGELVTGSEPCAVCEGVWEVSVPARASDYAEGAWTASDGTSARLAIATRLWTRLTPEQMVDLTFGRQERAPVSPAITRKAGIRDSFARSPWAALLAGVVCALALVRSVGRLPFDDVLLRAVAITGAVVTVFGVTFVTLLALVVAAVIFSHEAHRARPAAHLPFRARELTRTRLTDAALILLIAALPAGVVAQARAEGMWLGTAPGLLVAAVFLVVALGLIVTQALRDCSSRRAEPDVAAEDSRLPLPGLDLGTVAAASAVAVGWAAILIAAGSATPAPALIAADGAIARAYFAIAYALHPTALALGVEWLWVIGTVALLVQELRKWRPALRGQLVRLTVGMGLIYLLSMAFITPIPGLLTELHGLSWNIDAVSLLLHLAALATGIALLCFVALAPWATVRSRALAQGLAAVAALMGLLTIAGQVRLLVPAEAGSGSREGRALADQLDERLREIDAALETFAEDTGCYPARPADLSAAQAPAMGVDASGNPVALGGGYAGPYLPVLPVDPLTGRRDTWVYEVTGVPMADSGGYRLTVRAHEGPQRTTDRRRRWLMEREASAP